MTTEQLVWFSYKLADATEQPLEELAIGWMRYKALRRLNAEQYKQLIQDSMRGRNFDDMVDELVADLGR